jgi:superfamily I DNA and/or RNA helicase
MYTCIYMYIHIYAYIYTHTHKYICIHVRTYICVFTLGIRFHTVVMDEATQAVEPASLIALAHGARRLVMVGDQCQLPPTVTSLAARKAGLGCSLFERLVLGGLPTLLLTVQFRMHPALADFSSYNFYGGCLASYPSPEQRLQPKGFPWPRSNPQFPAAFVNVRHVSSSSYDMYPPPI